MKIIGWNNYFVNIKEGFVTSLAGLRLTLKHFFNAGKKWKNNSIHDPSYFTQQGIVTVQYPKESIPIPDNGRYRLHNEIEDCIVCDLCAKICPVDCIEIEPVKAVEEIGKTSDGTTKRIFAARFDIDMAKCCYCGLCTTVCPTECLTMTKTFDYTEFDIRDMTYHFTNLSPEKASEKKEEYAAFQQQKNLKKQTEPVKTITDVDNNKEKEVRSSPKIPFKPVIKKMSDPDEQKKVAEEKDIIEQRTDAAQEIDLHQDSSPVAEPPFSGKKPFKPVIKIPEKKSTESPSSNESTEKNVPPSPTSDHNKENHGNTENVTDTGSKEAINPSSDVQEGGEQVKNVQVKKPFKPVIKIPNKKSVIIQPAKEDSNASSESEMPAEDGTIQAFNVPDTDSQKPQQQEAPDPAPEKKKIFKPVIKRPASLSAQNEEQKEKKEAQDASQVNETKKENPIEDTGDSKGSDENKSIGNVQDQNIE